VPSCPSSRLFFLSVLLLAPTLALTAQSKQPLTVSAIFHDRTLTAREPQGIAWSPDGTRLTYLNQDGDLMAADVQGATTVLVPKEKLGSMYNSKASEQDKDHRARYNMSSYVWAPDSKHILFDANGGLFLYALKEGIGISIAQSSASGDDPKFAPDGSAVSYIHDHDLYLRRLP
jgi:dipeptidyl-peptidase-4